LPNKIFFNVPSSDITEKDRIFFQQQLNIFPKSIASNTTLCYGLGKKCEIGLNILGVSYDYDTKKLISSNNNEQPVAPSLGVNMQQQVLDYKDYDLAIGGQLAFPSKPKEFEYYIYLNNRFEFEKTKLVAGFYMGNNNYFGKETRFSNNLQHIGIQLGFEYEIMSDKLFLQADFISGRNSMSNVIFWGAYRFTEHLILSSGFQIPNTTSTSSNGLILELTYI
jgi:predicted lactoylglutathione lyase